MLARRAWGAPGRLGSVLGTFGDRVAQWVEQDVIAISSLRAGDPLSVRVYAVVAASRVGSDGSLWLRGSDDPDATLRRLDLAASSGTDAPCLLRRAGGVWQLPMRGRAHRPPGSRAGLPRLAAIRLTGFRAR